MAAETTSVKTTYEEFEPYCKWQREEGNDILEVHLQGFKKEQLRVQLNNLGTMRINGDRWVDNSKRTGFQKEIAVPKDVKNNEIRAKFSNGILYISMPKETPPALSPSPSPPSQNQPAILPPTNQENEPKTPKTGPGDVPKKTAIKELDGKENSMIKKKDNYGSKENEFVVIEIKRKMIVTFALLVAIGALLMYFRPSNFKM